MSRSPFNQRATGQRPPDHAHRDRRVGGRTALVLAGSLLWLLGAATLHAQTVYEWREPSGTEVYSQFPPKPAETHNVQQIDVRTLAPPAHRAAARLMLLGPERADHAAAWQAADERVAKGLAALQAAERAIREDATPGPSDRQHLANGHSKLTKSYFDRIASEERAISRARAELDAAYAERDALAAGTTSH